MRPTRHLSVSRALRVPVPTDLAGRLWGALALGSLVALAAAAGIPLESQADALGANVPGFSGMRTSPENCTQCHTMDPLFSHPVGVSVSAPVPGGLPLERGQVTCLTCHTVVDHANSAGSPGPMLRSVAGSPSLCVTCHAMSPGDHAGSHAVGVGRAHLSSAEVQARPAAPAKGVGMDPESRSCLECHDGMVAQDKGGQNRGDDWGPGSREHPIGVAYVARSSGRGAEGGLRDASRLNRRIRLFDQTVGCGSCHSIYSKASSQLVTSNAQSQLCLGCHVQ